MIQRIQSIWLLIAAALAVLAFFVSFYSGVPADPAVAATQPYLRITAQSSVLLMILTGLVAATSLILVFLYKNRRQQLLFTLANVLASIGLIFAFYGETSQIARGQGSLDLTSVVVFAVPLFLLLAARGIQHDERLVKSLNRLR